MKLLKSILLISFLTLFANANDEKENKEVLKNLYEKVILKDVEKTLTSLDNLKTSVKDKDKKRTQERFINLVQSWKAVEAFYILGDLNEDFIDTPRYVDIYHNGNEDITKQLDRAIKSDDEIRIALFKNSTKSINALEYMLFAKDINKQRINDIAMAIINKIQIHIEDIKKEYIAQEKSFLNELKKANAIVINAIIQNSYKLKEWRVGDVAGLSKKYNGKPDKRRAEYYLSKNSAIAIEAILNTYKKVLNENSYKDFGDFLIKLTDGSEMKKLKKSLDKSLALVKEIKNDDLSNAKDLFIETNKLHVILFVEMIEELSINAKILDADGD